MTRYSVIKALSRDPEEPDRFILAITGDGLPDKVFMKTSAPMLESEMRAELASLGESKLEIDSVIQRAKDNPERL